jgi:recombination protein RecR
MEKAGGRAAALAFQPVNGRAPPARIRQSDQSDDLSVIDDLTNEFARLPGIGRKTALRLTYHLLKRPPEEIKRLARALEGVADHVHACSRCGNLTEEDLCAFCASPRRDATLICVVEEASDIGAIERTGEYRGLYHVLGGRLSPLEGIGPDELNIAGLLARVRASEADGRALPVAEVIIATNPSVEGEATATFLQRQLQPLGVRVTRLARGIPVGGDLEYVDGVTLAQALSGRREL